ncbi:thiol methyltransferase [Phlyctema vagabunda]|uniref:Thiol methyltransferase n=1 Tax=Phlyctema vagabunda TaxID=108571 RepID=A0ABR4PMT6_9HELO
MADQPTDARARLLSHFQGQEPSAHGQKWDELWIEGFLPWDKGFPSPALVDLLAERQDLLGSSTGKKLKALVPGCGKGYDVLLLTAYGYDAYGLEISANAIDAAKKNEKEVEENAIYNPNDGVSKGKVTWLVGDFFNDEFLKDVDGDGGFDLIYDYTFLSAMPLSMRAAWSKRQNELLAPEGRLVCLEFPTYKPLSTGGPPFGLPPKIYTALLPRPGQELKYDDQGELLEAELGPPSSKGLKQIAHFKPKRTHEIGYAADGTITDWVGVWAHPNAV